MNKNIAKKAQCFMQTVYLVDINPMSYTFTSLFLSLYENYSYKRSNL